MIGRGVVFGKFSVRRTHEASHRKVEPRRAELPFVITEWRERPYFERLLASAQHVSPSLIDFGVACPALFVGCGSTIADACQDEAVLDAGNLRTMQRKPGDRSDRSRNEQETIGIATRHRGQVLREGSSNRDARQIVIAQRGMAHMA